MVVGDSILHLLFCRGKISNGIEIPQGAAAREVAEYVKAGKTKMSREFGYPMDTKRFSEFKDNNRLVQMEVFT